jgi:hypothetical protein
MTRKLHTSFAGILALGLLSASVVSAQPVASGTAGTDARARAIAAAFNKNKHVVKERRGVRHEKYKNVRSEPVIRANPQSLSGTYEVDDFGGMLRLRVDPDGRVTGSGEDTIGEGISRAFTISNGRVQGALLTGTKVFTGGGSERFEGAFLNRTSRDNPTDPGITHFGVGVTGKTLYLHGQTIDRLFYRLKAQSGAQPAA